jgi:integrase
MSDIEISRGEVYKRTWSTGGTKKNAYQFSFTVARGDVMKRVRGQMPTRAEAALEMERRKELERNPPAPKSAVPTVHEFATAWLDRAEREIAPRTMLNYKAHYRLYIRPAIGGLPLDQVRRVHVRQIVDVMRAKGLSKNTARLCRATVSVIFADAVERELVTVNPVVGANRRRDRASSVTAVERRQKVQAWTADELEKFLAVARRGAGLPGRQAAIDRRDYVLFLFLADTGARPSEALAVRWEDVDLAGRTVVIERALDLGGKVKPTKTGEARRIDLTSRLAAALSEYQAQLEADALVSDKEPMAGVFPSPLDADVVAKKFRRYVVRAGLPPVKLYSLRHTYASHLLAAGAPITYVSRMLGHSKATTTLQHYAHFIPTGDRRHVEVLEAARAHAAAHAPRLAPVVLATSR